jgi:hypothetical protein
MENTEVWEQNTECPEWGAVVVREKSWYKSLNRDLRGPGADGVAAPGRGICRSKGPEVGAC